RIHRRLLEVHGPVEHAAGPDELVHGLPALFELRRSVGALRTFRRNQRPADDPDSPAVEPLDALAKPGDHVLGRRWRNRPGLTGAEAADEVAGLTEVVDAFEPDDG